MTTTTKNPQAKPINQKRGPTTGNQSVGDKRSKFIAAKQGGEKVALADMITGALEARGRGMKPYIDDAVEGLHSDTGPKRNPTAGGTEYNVRKPGAKKITR